MNRDRIGAGRLGSGAWVEAGLRDRVRAMGPEVLRVNIITENDEYDIGIELGDIYF